MLVIGHADYWMTQKFVVESEFSLTATSFDYTLLRSSYLDNLEMGQLTGITLIWVPPQIGIALDIFNAKTVVIPLEAIGSSITHPFKIR